MNLGGVLPGAPGFAPGLGWPSPHLQPWSRRILPAWLLSVSSVLPFPQQEALSSWPLPHSACLPVPGPGTGFFLPPRACGRGAQAGAGWGQRARMHASSLCAVSSPGTPSGLGPWGPECQPQEQWTMEVVHGGPAASPRQCLHPLMMDRESGGSLSGWVLVVSQAPCPLIPP